MARMNIPSIFYKLEMQLLICKKNEKFPDRKQKIPAFSCRDFLFGF